jgi:hypothetical protein
MVRPAGLTKGNIFSCVQPVVYKIKVSVSFSYDQYVFE